MVSEQRAPPEETFQESKVTTVKISGTISGPLVRGSSAEGTRRRRRKEAVQLGLRLLCVVTSVVSLSLMVTAEEVTHVSMYGLHIPVHSKWSLSESYEYLVGVSAGVAAHSLLQLLIGTSRFLKKSSVVTSRNNAWLIFAGDQVFAYALMSAGSAGSGASNLNRTGIRHSVLPNFCKSLHKFCNHIALSIVFIFMSYFLLVASTIQDVIWLSQH